LLPSLSANSWKYTINQRKGNGQYFCSVALQSDVLFHYNIERVKAHWLTEHSESAWCVDTHREVSSSCGDNYSKQQNRNFVFSLIVLLYAVEGKVVHEESLLGSYWKRKIHSVSQMCLPENAFFLLNVGSDWSVQ
jgi:hypothetical protein